VRLREFSISVYEEKYLKFSTEEIRQSVLSKAEEIGEWLWDQADKATTEQLRSKRQEIE
jgi:hypothetical protein